MGLPDVIFRRWGGDTPIALSPGCAPATPCATGNAPGRAEQPRPRGWHPARKSSRRTLPAAGTAPGAEAAVVLRLASWAEGQGRPAAWHLDACAPPAEETARSGFYQEPLHYRAAPPAPPHRRSWGARLSGPRGSQRRAGFQERVSRAEGLRGKTGQPRAFVPVGRSRHFI